jgi:putative PIN family toxin of toxin-antitoxin system
VIRVVIDPGVFISALIGGRGGAPDLVVRAFVDDRIRVVASPLLLAELELVLRRQKFAAYVDERAVREFVERIRRHATIVSDPVEQPAVTRDRKDDYLVAARTQRARRRDRQRRSRPHRCRARRSSGVDSTAAGGPPGGGLNELTIRPRRRRNPATRW